MFFPCYSGKDLLFEVLFLCKLFLEKDGKSGWIVQYYEKNGKEIQEKDKNSGIVWVS